jgi:hypothetical protein
MAKNVGVNGERPLLDEAPSHQLQPATLIPPRSAKAHRCIWREIYKQRRSGQHVVQAQHPQEHPLVSGRHLCSDREQVSRFLHDMLWSTKDYMYPSANTPSMQYHH